MSTAAEQYRALVVKLENIQEAPELDAAAPAAAPAGIPTISAGNFKQAYAQAKKQGLKTFKWCGTYKVQDAPGASAQRVPVAPQAAAVVTNPMGDYDPTSFSGSALNRN